MSTITQFPSGNTQYRIEFDYLARTFVVVTLVNSANPTMNRVLEVGRDYRFLNPTMIEMLVDQSGFDIVRIHRQTGTELVVDFRNGSVLTASDLTNAELQAIHIAEEGRDQTVDLAKEYADAAGSSAGNAKDSEDEARRIAERIKAAGLVGYITRRSFEKGFNVTTWNEALLWEEDGDYYRWDGTLPKNVPAGSTPETSGGIGLGAWVSVGDAALRSALASVGAGEGADMVGYRTPLSNSSSTVGDTLDIKYPAIIGNVSAPETGLMFDSYESYTGNHDIRLTEMGSVPKSTKRIKKTGNATVTLTSIAAVPPLTVDTVAYVNPSAPDTNTIPAGTTIEGLTFEGDDSGGQSGLTILQGHSFKLNNLGFLKTKIALWMTEVWMTEIRNITAWGQILHEGGTSANYTNVFAKVTDPTVTPGAFRISNQQYGNMRSCASDGTVYGAYWFDNNNGFNLTGCGAELPTTQDAALGVLGHFHRGNDMTLTDFYILPAGGTGNLLSVSSDNNLTFNNFLVFGHDTSYSRDLWIHGTGNNIVFNGGSFGGNAIPRVACSGEGNTVRYNTPTNSYIYKGGITTLAVFEPFSLSSVLDSSVVITFGDITSDIGSATKDVKLRKEGGLITLEFDISFNGAGGQTGQLRFRNLPYASSDVASGAISRVSGFNSGVGKICISMERNSTTLDFYKLVDVSSTSPLTNEDLTPSATIRGSITYKISTWFE